MRITNYTFILAIAGISGFLSAIFWIGTTEDKLELTNELLISFSLRLLGSIIFGMILISALLLINYIIYRIKPTLVDLQDIKHVAKVGLVAVSFFCLLGCFVFFAV